MENYSKTNVVLSILWGCLSVATLVVAIYATFTPGKYLFPSILALSIILFLLARQRLPKYEMKEEKFELHLRNLGIFIAVFSAVGVAAITNV